MCQSSVFIAPFINILLLFANFGQLNSEPQPVNSIAPSNNLLEPDTGREIPNFENEFEDLIFGTDDQIIPHRKRGEVLGHESLKQVAPKEDPLLSAIKRYPRSVAEGERPPGAVQKSRVRKLRNQRQIKTVDDINQDVEEGTEELEDFETSTDSYESQAIEEVEDSTEKTRDRADEHIFTDSKHDPILIFPEKSTFLPLPQPAVIELPDGEKSPGKGGSEEKPKFDEKEAKKEEDIARLHNVPSTAKPEGEEPPRPEGKAKQTKKTDQTKLPEIRLSEEDEREDTRISEPEEPEKRQGYGGQKVSEEEDDVGLGTGGEVPEFDRHTAKIHHSGIQQDKPIDEVCLNCFKQ